MRILVVDDEIFALENVVAELKKALTAISPEKMKLSQNYSMEGAEIFPFRIATQALEFIRETPCDIAFLDVEMLGMNGVALAAELKKLYPQINIIFTTAYSEYMQSAFELYASGYCLKPVTAEKIMRELENLRHQVKEEALIPQKKGRLKVKTFGNFEAFIDGEPIHFKYSKSKELLAYLIDRNGSMVTNRELVAVLWEEDTENHFSYLKKIRSELILRLKEGGCEDTLIQQWGSIGIVPKQIECDYFDYLKGLPDAINSYRGEYMSQYGWSEYTHGSFDF